MINTIPNTSVISFSIINQEINRTLLIYEEAIRVFNQKDWSRINHNNLRAEIHKSEVKEDSITLYDREERSNNSQNFIDGDIQDSDNSLSIAEARTILGENYKHLSDKEVDQIKISCEVLARIALASFKNKIAIESKKEMVT